MNHPSITGQPTHPPEPQLPSKGMKNLIYLNVDINELEDLTAKHDFKCKWGLMLMLYDSDLKKKKCSEVQCQKMLMLYFPSWHLFISPPLFYCEWKLLHFHLLSSSFSFRWNMEVLWRGPKLWQWPTRALSSFSSLLSLALYEMTMLPCYRNASCIPRWKRQDVADAHRFFQPAGPALRPSQ